MKKPPTRSLTTAEEQFLATYREIMKVSRINARYASILSNATRVAAERQGLQANALAGSQTHAA